MKTTGTSVARRSVSEARRDIRTFWGLPLAVAITYVCIFSFAFWFYISMWPSAPMIADDSASYLRVAQDLADFRVDQLNSRPPGYPLLLVFTGAGRSLFHTSLILHFISIWLIAAVLYALGLKDIWLVILGVLLALPPYVEYAAYVLTDNLSEFLLVAAFSFIVFWFLFGRRTRYLLLSAVAMACSGVTRPTYQVLSIVVTVFLVFFWGLFGNMAITYRTCIKAGFVLLTTSAILIGGFSFVNYAKFDFFGVYPMTGFNLSTRTVRFLERLPDEYATEREALIKARNSYLIQPDGDHTPFQSYWWAVPDLVKITGLQPIPDLAQRMLHLNLLLITKAPLYYLQEVFWSFSGYWLPSATAVANMNSIAVQIVWVALHFGVLAVFILQLSVVLGVMLLMFSRRVVRARGQTYLRLPVAHSFTYLLAGTIVFYNAFATSLSEVGDPRYRIPTEPLIVLMCFLGLYLWRYLLINDCP